MPRIALLVSMIVGWLPSLVLAATADTVLVVANSNNAQSSAVADYYIFARGIPAANKLLVNWTASDSADSSTLSVFQQQIMTPIYSKIASLPHIDYIVLCRNLPLKLTDISRSADSVLAGNKSAQTPN